MSDRAISWRELPEPVARPVQWRRLLRSLKTLHDGNPAELLDAAYSVGDAIGGASDERQLRRILATADGQALWRRRSSLVDALADHDALAQLPAGSFGRAYLAFCRRHGLNSRALVDHQHAMSRDYARLDPVRQWFFDRLVVMHDLCHVLAGYDATTAGESALMCFLLPHRFNDRALPIFVLMSVLAGNISARNAREAFQRGRRARFLVAAPFEDLLARPLSDVRAQYGVTPPEVGHPVVTSAAMLVPAEARA
jgi:ubiquinone biosynthesis protein COQ4